MRTEHPKKSSRRELVEEVIELFIEFVLTLKSSEMPKWVDLDLTASQMRAMVFLAVRGPVNMSELAKFARVGNAAASILVQQLVEQELVERSEDATDRRRTLVRLSPHAAELMSERREQREAKVRQWLRRLGDDELGGLARGLRPLIEIVRADQASTDPQREKPVE